MILVKMPERIMDLWMTKMYMHELLVLLIMDGNKNREQNS